MGLSVLQQFPLVFLELLQGDVPGMGIGKKDCPFFPWQFLEVNTPVWVLSLTRAAPEKCSCIARIMEKE